MMSSCESLNVSIPTKNLPFSPFLETPPGTPVSNHITQNSAVVIVPKTPRKSLSPAKACRSISRRRSVVLQFKMCPCPATGTPNLKIIQKRSARKRLRWEEWESKHIDFDLRSHPRPFIREPPINCMLDNDSSIVKCNYVNDADDEMDPTDLLSPPHTPKPKMISSKEEQCDGEVVLYCFPYKRVQNRCLVPSKLKTCASCKTTKTPLWRDSEDGTPYCNACGIRYKKYRVRCPVCHCIPHKDEVISNTCCMCYSQLSVVSKSKKSLIRSFH